MRVLEAKRLARKNLNLEQILNFMLLGILSGISIGLFTLITALLLNTDTTIIAGIILVPILLLALFIPSIMTQEMAMLNAKYCRAVSVGEVFKRFKLGKYLKTIIIQVLISILPSLIMSLFVALVNFMGTNNTVRVEVDNVSLAVITIFIAFLLPVKFMFAPCLYLDDNSRGIFGSIVLSWKISKFFKVVFLIISFIPGLLIPILISVVFVVLEQPILLAILVCLITLYLALYLVPYINISTFHLMYQALDARGESGYDAEEENNKEEEM